MKGGVYKRVTNRTREPSRNSTGYFISSELGNASFFEIVQNKSNPDCPVRLTFPRINIL